MAFGRKERGVYDSDKGKADADLASQYGLAQNQKMAAMQEADRAKNILAQEQAAATQGTVAGADSGDPKQKQLSPDAIKNSEDTVGKGYTGSGPKPNDSPEELSRKKQVLNHFKARWSGGKKKGLLLGALGGGGLIGGLGLFSITLGPLQFMHISQMLLDHDFSALDDANDDKASRLLRYVFYAKQGRVERTRLGALGNKYADRAEARLNSVGFKSGYTPVFGFKNALIIDRRFPEYRGMNDQQLIQHIKAETGQDLIHGRDLDGSIPALRDANIFAIDAKSLNYRQTKKLNKYLLQKAGLNKVTSALGTNLLRKRAGITLHPIKALDRKVLMKLEAAFQNWRKERTERTKNGQFTPPKAAPGTDEKSPEDQRSQAQSAADAGQSTIDEGSATNAKIKGGDAGALSKFSDTINSKWAAGGLAALTVPCILRGIADDADNIKHTEVVLPAIRMGTEAIALGQQGAAGYDLTAEQMGFYNQLATGAENKEGQPTSTWSESRVMQILNGADPDTKPGVPPSGALLNIFKGTPFDFLNEGGIGNTLDVVCSPVVQGSVMVISFFGGPVSAAIGILTGPITQSILHEAAKWMAGSPLDVNAEGAEWGNNIAYGSRLASNDQALASGGTVVNKETEKSIDSGAKYALDEEFQSKSLAYRLFNPKDYRTPVARFIDRQNVDSASTNIASLATNFLNVGGQFGSLAFGLFSGHSSAAGTGYYDYGFPRVAVDPAVFMKPDYENPYKTADDAADILDGPNGQDYIDKAKRCNGITIKKDGDGLWNVVSDPESTPHMKDYGAAECSADGSVAANSTTSNPTVASSNSERKHSGWASSFTNLANTFGTGLFGLFSGRAAAQSVSSAPQVKAAAGDKNWETITQFVSGTTNMNGLACKLGDDQGCADIGFAAAPAGDSGAAPVGIGGDARSIAKLIDDNPNITFQTTQKETDFKQIVDTGAQKDCGTTIPISPVLLSIIQSLADPAKGANAYKIVLGVFSLGHGCDATSQHNKGTAVDINGLSRGGVTTGNFLHFKEMNAGQMALTKQFYQDFANSFPEKTGGMGQYTTACFSGGLPPKRVGGPIYFPDSPACDHLHVDARKN
jgi:hypothetical protein